MNDVDVADFECINWLKKAISRALMCDSSYCEKPKKQTT